MANLFTRDDTFFGVCAGLGEDLGFNPDWLRVALAGLLFFNPAAAFVTYFALGAVVLASRLLAPAPRAKAAPALPAPSNDAVALPLAA